MSLRGLWRWAEADPDRIALIEVSGRETSMAELAGDANRVVHALRKLGPFQVYIPMKVSIPSAISSAWRPAARSTS